MDSRPASDAWRTLPPLPMTARRTAHAVIGRRRVRAPAATRPVRRRLSLLRSPALPRVTRARGLYHLGRSGLLPMRPPLRPWSRGSGVAPSIPAAGVAPATVSVDASGFQDASVASSAPPPSDRRRHRVSAAPPQVQAEPRSDEITHRKGVRQPNAELPARVIPRPLPSVFAPLVRALVGDSADIEIVTGPSIRRGLRADGASAATVGKRIHLGETPRPSPVELGVVAHELSHVADEIGVGRMSPADSEERAQSLGTAIERSALVQTAIKKVPHPQSAPRLRASLELPRATPRSAPDVPVARAAVPLATVGRQPAAASPPRRVLDGAPASQPSVRKQSSETPSQPSTRHPQSSSPGLQPHFLLGPSPPDLGSISSRVDDLPVGGVAATVGGALQSPLASRLAGAVPGAQSPVDSVATPVESGSAAAAAPAPPQPGQPAATSVHSTPACSTAESPGAHQAPPAADGLQIGALVEALEDRVMAELERRGGRYTGVF